MAWMRCGREILEIIKTQRKIEKLKAMALTKSFGGMKKENRIEREEIDSSRCLRIFREAYRFRALSKNDSPIQDQIRLKLWETTNPSHLPREACTVRIRNGLFNRKIRFSFLQESSCQTFSLLFFQYEQTLTKNLKILKTSTNRIFVVSKFLLFLYSDFIYIYYIYI